MILDSLTMNDFQIFKGSHTIDLAPRLKHKKRRPIILFGGLNGSGKTTTLTAIRLALYGKQALGSTVSNKAYEQYLTECIHHAKNSLVQPNASSIELTFNYSEYGDLKTYTIKRAWDVSKKKLTEKLSIFEEGKELSELSQDQCQGFLNELIPFGVSELFFFDGEKIADLAEDDTGLNLGDSIKKLLGLDVIDTLRADLGIYIRSNSDEGLKSSDVKQISNLEKQLQTTEEEAKMLLDEITDLRPMLLELSSNIEKVENNILAQGGGWANSREKEIAKRDQLLVEKQKVSKELQECIGGSFPICFSPKLSKRCISQLREEEEAQAQKEISTRVKERMKKIKEAFEKRSLSDDNIKIVEDAFRDITSIDNSTTVIHDKSMSQIRYIESVITDSTKSEKKKAKELVANLEEIELELDRLGANIARSPDEKKLEPLMEQLRQYQEEEKAAVIKKTELKESYKSKVRQAIELTRQLDRISQSALQLKEKNRAVIYAQSSRDILKSFSENITTQKIEDLEQEFSHSYQRLARKDDTWINAKIDPKNFSVSLLDKKGKVIDKNRLSAGEKQIYAISILEALAKTSGKKLPIIIDTPLGRLDSKHRNNLIQNYFPHASHQVLILSTDTEVDEAFYKDLSVSISHAYRLEYDSEAGCSTPTEGYFWKHSNERAA